MATPTTGPWKLTERSGYYEILGPRDAANWYGTEGIWAVAYCDTDRDEDEQIANGHLIAAAPELFAALFGLWSAVVTEAFEPDPGKPTMLRDGMRDRWIERARIALAQARGDQS